MKLIKQYLKSNAGSIVVEACVVFMVLMLILTYGVNAAVNFSREDRLNRLSYQVASLVRESQLYADGNFTQDDAQNIFFLVDKLAKNFIKNPEQKISIAINMLDYDDSKNSYFFRGECPLILDFDYHELLQNKNNSLIVLGICVPKESVVGNGKDFTPESLIIAKSAVIRR